MLAVGLTGGIASGKSCVSRLLAEKGAVIIDADQIAREVVAPGMPALAAIERRFGSAVINPDGTLNRDELGAIVFEDPEANQALRAITHPEIGSSIVERLAAQAGTDNVVVLDAALLVESGWQGLDTLIVVAADPDVQVERMLRDRKMEPAQARARIRNQAPLEAKLAQADIVVWNNGSLDELRARVDEVWDELNARRRERK